MGEAEKIMGIAYRNGIYVELKIAEELADEANKEKDEKYKIILEHVSQKNKKTAEKYEVF